MKLYRRSYLLVKICYLCPVRFRLEERAIILNRLSEIGGVWNVHFFKPHGHEIGTKLLADKLYREEPVLFIRIRYRAVYAEITALVIMCQELLDFKIIRIVECDKLRIRQLNLSALDFFFKIPVFVVPEYDPAVIEFRERSCEPAI